MNDIFGNKVECTCFHDHPAGPSSVDDSPDGCRQNPFCPVHPDLKAQEWLREHKPETAAKLLAYRAGDAFIEDDDGDHD